MSRIISKRYPVVNGDIDRAWLVDQLPRAKRPNALLSVALSPLRIPRIAALTWVSTDVLIDFVLGADDLTPLELRYLCRALEIYNAPTDEDWMLTETLASDDDEEFLESAAEMLQSMPEDNPVTPLVVQLMKWERIPYVAAFTPLLFSDMAADGIRLGDQVKPRCKRITRRRRRAA